MESARKKAFSTSFHSLFKP